MLVTKPFAARVSARLDKISKHLPVNASDKAMFLSILSDGDYIYAELNDGIQREYVKIERQCDTLLLARAIEGEDAKTFPVGTCIRDATPPTLIKDLICNYDCCSNKECPCDPVQVAGATVTGGVIGQDWSCTVVFSGDLPMHIVVTGATAWMDVKIGPNYVVLSGIPEVTEMITLAVTATNCSGEIATYAQVIPIGVPS